MQLIYYLQFSLSVYTPNISSLQDMSLVGLDNLFWGDELSIRFWDEYQFVPYSVGYA